MKRGQKVQLLKAVASGKKSIRKFQASLIDWSKATEQELEWLIEITNRNNSGESLSLKEITSYNKLIMEIFERGNL